MAVSASLLPPAPAATQTLEPIGVLRPARVTVGDLVPTRTYASPFVLVDPREPRRVVAATVEMRTNTCRLFRSEDAGRTWRALDALPTLESYPFCLHWSAVATQTPLAWGRNGTLYYGLAGWDTGDGGMRANMSILLARSSDLGDSWQTTIVRDARGKQGPATENNRAPSSVAVDTESGPEDIVYVGWRAAYPQKQPPVPAQALVAVSVDGGRTFSEPVSVAGAYLDDPAHLSGPGIPPDKQQKDNFSTGFSSPSLALDDAGRLYTPWARASRNITPEPPRPMVLSVSSDRGRTFEGMGEVTPPSYYQNDSALLLRWSRFGGSQGTLHAIYEDKDNQTQGDRDVHYRRSTDGGRTWTSPNIVHDDDPRQQYGQFLPNISVAPSGRVDAAWWDWRNSEGRYATDVYYSYSTDHGVTWSKNIRVTDRLIDRTLGPWSNGFDMRQPPGLASTDEFAILLWDDTRNGEEVGQAQDLYAGGVQFEALPGSRASATELALAATGGVASVGILLFPLVRRMRRSDRAASSSAAERKVREPAR